jgi:hypothetical protein
MRIFKQVSKGGTTVVTISLWGEDDAIEETIDLLSEIIEELEEQKKE